MDEAVGRHEQDGVAALDERVADGAQRVALADAREPEGQHVGRVLQEVAVGELVQPAHQRRRQAAFIEGGEGLAGRESGGPAQTRDPALVSLLGFQLQDLEEQRQRRLLLGLHEPRHQFAGGGREPEPREPGRDLIADGGGRGGAAHAAAPARSASYTVRSGAAMWITGTVSRGGATWAWTVT